MTRNHSQPENRKGVRQRSHEPREDQRAGAALVSVVIPCYNQAHFLSEAIESVLAQSYPHFEIVVVDDGSTDDTPKVAARYPAVRCIRQDNRGLSAARNAGLGCSEGEYVVFLDADDRLLPEALEVGLECFDANPECAFVCGLYRRIAADGSFLFDRKRRHVVKSVGEIRTRRDVYAALLHRNYIIMHATVMYRRTVFASVGGFDDSLGACEDYDLYLRIARKFPVHNYDKVVAEYRQHGGNMTSNPALMLSSSVTALRSQRRHAKRDERFSKAYRTGMRFWQDAYGNPLIEEVRARARKRDWQQALQGILVLLQYYPRGLLALLGERRTERHNLVVQLRARKQELLAQRQRLRDRTERLQKLKGTLAEEPRKAQRLRMRGAVAKERQEVQRLRKHGQRLMRQVQSLDQQLRAEQDAKGIKLLKRMWRDRYGVGRLVNQVRTGALKRKWWQAMRGTLLKYYPREQQLQELKGSLAKERRKVRRLEKQTQRLKLRMQTLNQQARTSESLQQRERRPPSVDQVDFGSLRQVNPISREFGYDRGKPVDRYYIENFLAARAGDIRGRVLEVKDDTYTRKYGGEQVDVSDVIDMAEDNRQATIVADLTRADRVPSDAFDCIIFTQTLQLIYDMRSAIQTLHRVLKPGGVLLATFPGISQISYKDCGDSWCWEFTQLSVRRLFEESFSGADISIEAHGNVLAAIAFLHGLAAEELRREELDYRDPDYEVLITLRAVKQQAQT